ncbi:MAG: GHKL domain-containing protein [Bdellovibrionales bacterium]|nr:GHKL domain-containing protein [Bdellovibrionales bacterium]
MKRKERLMSPTKTEESDAVDLKTTPGSVSNFPRKTAFLAILGSVVFLVLQFLSLKSGHYILQEMNQFHFPLTERNAISLRLHEKITTTLHLAVVTHKSNFIDDILAYREALDQNQSVLIPKFAPKASSFQLFALPRRNLVDRFELETINLMKIQEFGKALEILDSEEYKDELIKYSEAMQSLAEEMSTRRDAILDDQTKQLYFTGTISISVFVITIFFWGLFIKAYLMSIKARKTAEHLLDEEKAKTIQASKLSTLGEMAGGIAHEINNPLAIIHGYAEILTRQLSKEVINKDKLNDVALKIRETTNRIEKIVKALRTYARDGSKSHFLPCDVRKIVDETLTLCMEKLKNRDIQLIYNPPSHPVILKCQEVQISQVILNLIQNAVDAIETQTTKKWLEIEVLPLSNTCQIRMTDSGLGIPKNLQDKILQPFFTTKDIGKGTGLGLSISSSIVRDHGGRFFYDKDHPNTSFVMEIPLAQEHGVTMETINTAA